MIDMSELLLQQRDDRGVVTLTLNDPARFNALGDEMLAALVPCLCHVHHPTDFVTFLNH